ncbi:MAG: YkgJ family cysteine cluster protein [Deltaproteobacteria bacterium]|nr:YkgJ family cysteine cluster protein [Deltaproteobacteria bacterium]
MSENELLQLLQGNTFHFSCHKSIECFTKCCAALQLVLTPYDIMRMKTRLGIASDLFLETYTVTRIDRHPRFPMVLLKMTDDAAQTCPFVTSAGCALYEDRPGACRIYPLARAAQRKSMGDETKETYFLVRENHCRGFEEDHLWTVQSWMSDQGLTPYNTMNDQWLEITCSPRSLGPVREIPSKLQMFFMVSYNLDKFRRFLFGSRFFQRFYAPDDLQAQIEKDDVALMGFGFEWLKFSLFGLPTIKIK